MGLNPLQMQPPKNGRGVVTGGSGVDGPTVTPPPPTQQQFPRKTQPCCLTALSILAGRDPQLAVNAHRSDDTHTGSSSSPGTQEGSVRVLVTRRTDGKSQSPKNPSLCSSPRTPTPGSLKDTAGCAGNIWLEGLWGGGGQGRGGGGWGGRAGERRGGAYLGKKKNPHKTDRIPADYSSRCRCTLMQEEWGTGLRAGERETARSSF